MTDILETLDGAWDEDHKMNLMHYCDLAAQEIRRLRALKEPAAPSAGLYEGLVAAKLAIAELHATTNAGWAANKVFEAIRERLNEMIRAELIGKEGCRQ